MVGIVKWFSPNRGYGFIAEADGKDLFVHYSAIESKGYRLLESGDVVEYEVVKNKERREANKVTKK